MRAQEIRLCAEHRLPFVPTGTLVGEVAQAWLKSQSDITPTGTEIRAAAMLLISHIEQHGGLADEPD